MNLVYGLALHEFSVTQWIERPPGVWEIIGSNFDSDFFFVPPLVTCPLFHLKIYHLSFFHQSLYGFLVNNHVFSSDWMTPKHWLPKVIISGNISSISYHYHHTDPADNFFFIFWPRKITCSRLKDTYSNEQRSPNLINKTCTPFPRSYTSYSLMACSVWDIPTIWKRGTG